MGQPARRSIGALLIVPIVLGAFLAGRATPGDGYRLFNSVTDLVAREAVDSLDADQIYERAARGLVARLGDPYADLQDSAAFERYSRTVLANRYGGIGVVIIQHRGALAVLRNIPGGAADIAGIRPGDLIAAVNDSVTAGWSVDRASRALTGTPGTTVRVVLERGPGRERREYSLGRRVISPPTVPFATLLAGGIGYLPLERFSDHSALEVAESVRRLVNAGARGLLLDLRGNLGGDLDQAVAVASLFLQPGQTVARVRYRRTVDTMRTSILPVLPPGLPMVVLQDSLSASAAEIVAGSLQDCDRALVVGTVSYGKGLVQGVYRLPGNWRLRITSGHWYTPSGRLIQRTRSDSEGDRARPVFHSRSGRVVYGGGGIVPDIAVEATPAAPAPQALATLLGSRAALATAILDSLGVELESEVAAGLQSQEAWRVELVRRLRNAGIQIPDSLVAAGSDYLDRLIAARAGLFVLSDSARFLSDARRDLQLERARRLLSEAGTQVDLLALAAREKNPG
jgi:carboxyl-terminal processing protease